MKSCYQHPKYKVVLPPRTFCGPCWKMYEEKYGQDKTLIAYYKFVGRLVQEGRVKPKKVREFTKNSGIGLDI